MFCWISCARLFTCRKNCFRAFIFSLLLEMQFTHIHMDTYIHTYTRVCALTNIQRTPIIYTSNNKKMLTITQIYWIKFIREEWCSCNHPYIQSWRKKKWGKWGIGHFYKADYRKLFSLDIFMQGDRLLTRRGGGGRREYFLNLSTDSCSTHLQVLHNGVCVCVDVWVWKRYVYYWLKTTEKRAKLVSQGNDNNLTKNKQNKKIAFDYISNKSGN